MLRYEQQDMSPTGCPMLSAARHVTHRLSYVISSFCRIGESDTARPSSHTRDSSETLYPHIVVLQHTDVRESITRAEVRDRLCILTSWSCDEQYEKAYCDRNGDFHGLNTSLHPFELYHAPHQHAG